jgi:hypothetical protein
VNTQKTFKDVSSSRSLTSIVVRNVSFHPYGATRGV